MPWTSAPMGATDRMVPRHAGIPREQFPALLTLRGRPGSQGGVMAFRRLGVVSERDEPCWCGAVVIVTTGKDTDGKPYSFESCSEDVFHDTTKEK